MGDSMYTCLRRRGRDRWTAMSRRGSSSRRALLWAVEAMEKKQREGEGEKRCKRDSRIMTQPSYPPIY